MKQMKMKACPECGSSKVSLRANEYTCGKCGLVIEQGFYSGERIVA